MTSGIKWVMCNGLPVVSANQSGALIDWRMRTRHQVIQNCSAANRSRESTRGRSSCEPIAVEKRCHRGSLLATDSNTRRSINVRVCHFLTTPCHFLLASDCHFAALDSDTTATFLKCPHPRTSFSYFTRVNWSITIVFSQKIFLI